MSDLAQHLRSVSGCTQKTFLHSLDWEDGRKIITEAADRIEALEAALITEWAARDNRIEALEAALREAEALGKYWQARAIKAEGIPAAIAEGQDK